MLKDAAEAVVIRSDIDIVCICLLYVIACDEGEECLPLLGYAYSCRSFGFVIELVDAYSEGRTEEYGNNGCRIYRDI